MRITFFHINEFQTVTALFVEMTNSIKYSWHGCQKKKKSIAHRCIGLFLDSLFHLVNLYVYLNATYQSVRATSAIN